MSQITCFSMEQFILVCSGLVREGIIFKADADALIINLSGGF